MAVSLVSTGVTFPDNSTQTTAATGFGFKNRIINGAMVIDQRNAGASVSLSAVAQFPVDRFTLRMDASSGSTAARSTVAPSGFINSLLITVGTGAAPTAAQVGFIDQRIEGFNVSDLAWGTSAAQPITISFQVRSSVTGTFGASVRNSAVTRCYVASYTVNSANTWETKTITISGDTSGTWLTDNGVGIYLSFDTGEGSNRSAAAGSWLSANTPGLSGGVKICATTGATFYITGVQLEKGSTATSFDYRPYGTELALCMRYFEIYTTSSGSTQNLYLGYAIGGSNAWSMGPLMFQVAKRATPTVTVSNLAGSNFSGPTPNPSINYTVLQFTSASAGNTQVNTANGNTWLTVASEL